MSESFWYFQQTSPPLSLFETFVKPKLTLCEALDLERLSKWNEKMLNIKSFLFSFPAPWHIRSKRPPLEGISENNWSLVLRRQAVLLCFLPNKILIFQQSKGYKDTGKGKVNVWSWEKFGNLNKFDVKITTWRSKSGRANWHIKTFIIIFLVFAIWPSYSLEIVQNTLKLDKSVL